MEALEKVCQGGIVAKSMFFSLEQYFGLSISSILTYVKYFGSIFASCMTLITSQDCLRSLVFLTSPLTKCLWLWWDGAK
jgi:hypothetical protein